MMLRCLFPILLCAGHAAGQADDIWTQAVRGGGKQQQAQQRQLPAGFKLAAQSGTGQAIIGTSNGGRSARAAFSGALRHVAGYFDSAPVLQSAFADAKDEQVQAFFRGGYRGGPIQGLMIVNLAGGTTYAALLFDRPELFSRSLPNLTRQVEASLPKGEGGGGGGPAPAPPMTRTQLPDGSGWVNLPQGYVITGSFKGVVDIAGPQGQSISLGGYQQVFMRGSPGSTMMFGPYRPPWDALLLYMDCTYKGVLSRREASARLIEHSPAPFQNGESEYLSYEVTHSKGKVRGLAYVGTSRIPSDISLWLYYSSVVTAPSERFARDLPTLWAIWKSWTVNPAVFRERMDAALQSMRETYSLMKSVNDTRNRAYDNANYAWSETIRGVTMVQNLTTGARREIDTNHAQPIVDELNRQGHQYRVVPTGELTQ